MEKITSGIENFDEVVTAENTGTIEKE